MAIHQVADLIKLDYRFDLSAGGTVVEHADFGIWFKSATVPTFSTDWQNVLQEMASLAYERFNHFVDPGNYHSSVALQQTRVTHTNTDGTAQQIATGVAAGGDDFRGTASNGSLPWQDSLVISLYSYPRGTFVPNQRQKRGRFYLPPFDTGILQNADTGLIADDDAAQIAGELGLVLDALQTHTYTAFAGFSPVPGVNSRGPFKVPATPPAFYPLVQLSVDNKLDTQRLRTKNLPGNIQTAPYPPS